MAASRLQLLQARFQQKQLQEKEQKLLQLYDQQQQRAHQVAQRGSAGSNGSNHSISANANKVKQLFAENERRQQNGVKGIDKSYPLEPLKSKKTSPISKTTSHPGRPSVVANNNNNSCSSNMTNRKFNSSVGGGTGGAKRATKADVNSNVSNSSGGGRSIGNFAASSRQENSNSMSRGSYVAATTSSGTSASESIRQVNGHGTNNGYHYEINIDEVIDNEALQRNRMLAKFQPGDIERRRRQLSGTNDIDVVDDDQFPKDTQHYQQQDDASRKSSLKNTKSNPTIAASTAKKTIPRESTLMKTTQSASLKVCKAPQNRNRLVMRRKSSLIRKQLSASEQPQMDKKAKRKRSVEPAPSSPLLEQRCCEISERCFPPPWNTLKSTSLICEIIRKHSKLQQMRNKSSMGRVRTIVTKIENQTYSMKPIATTTPSVPKFVPVAKSIEKRLLEMTRDAVEPAAALPPTTLSSQEPLDLLNANFVEALKAAESGSSETKNAVAAMGVEEGDGLVARDVDVAEDPSDYQEIQVANETIEQQIRSPSPSRGLLSNAEDSVNRVRRASFEQKRTMFELLLQQQQQQHHRRPRVSRHNSVESVLRRFDTIDASYDDKKQSHRSCRKASTSSDSGQRILRGFERSTSAWTIRTKTGRKKKSASGKKILEARDSIELTRVPVLVTNLPACKKKIILHSRRNDDAQIMQISDGCRRRRADDADVERSSSPVASASKMDFYVCPSSTTAAAATSLKKADSVAKMADAITKNVTPYPSSKSPDSTEPRSRSVVKSTSLKLLSRFAGSNGDVQAPASNETDHHHHHHHSRKSSIHEQQPQQQQPSDEVKPATPTSRAPMSPAPRSSPSSSSNLVGGPTRGHGNRQAASGGASLTKAKTPTPAVRTTAPTSNANADDSLVTCKICARRFQPERVVKHEQICAKTAQKKRKQFDAVGHRVKGTELESFVQKPNKKLQSKGSVAAASSSSSSSSVKPDTQKSNWRRKHEDFINAIRSAKQMQAHLSAGGKLSDLPPPPPSDTSDYVQCPHCSRKFNQGAAERHIPRCETMQHNKPKPRPKR